MNAAHVGPPRRWLAVAAGFAALFGLVLAGVLSGAVSGLDTAVADAALALRAPWLTDAMRVATEAGEFRPMLAATVLAVVAALIARRPAYLVLFALWMPAANLLVEVLKDLLRRPRPTLPALIPFPDSYGFPSGHTSASAVFFGLLAVLVLREARRRAVRVSAVAACVACALAIALSRVYLGVHRFSDLLASWALAGMWLALALAVLAWLARRAPIEPGAAEA